MPYFTYSTFFNFHAVYFFRIECRLMLVDADWCWLMLINADRCRFILRDADWCQQYRYTKFCIGNQFVCPKRRYIQYFWENTPNLHRYFPKLVPCIGILPETFYWYFGDILENRYSLKTHWQPCVGIFLSVLCLKISLRYFWVLEYRYSLKTRWQPWLLFNAE